LKKIKNIGIKWIGIIPVVTIKLTENDSLVIVVF